MSLEVARLNDTTMPGMIAAGEALKIQDHNAGFLHALQKQDIDRDYLQAERMAVVQLSRLMLFVRWKLLPIPSALCPLDRRFGLPPVCPRGRVVPHVLRAALGMANCRSCPEQCAQRGRARDILAPNLPLHPEHSSASLQGSQHWPVRCCFLTFLFPLCGWLSPSLPAAHRGYCRESPQTHSHTAFAAIVFLTARADGVFSTLQLPSINRYQLPPARTLARSPSCVVPPSPSSVLRPLQSPPQVVFIKCPAASVAQFVCNPAVTLFPSRLWSRDPQCQLRVRP